MSHPAARTSGRRLYYGWVLVLTLGLTETTSWGILYYAFPVFLQPMERELGWSRAGMAGAFSLALLISGLAAVPVGRWLDRHGARLLMTVGSCAGALLVLAWAAVGDLGAFYPIWAAVGLAMAAVLYEPAFAVVAVWFARRRTQALTALTLVAALASTIFVPLAQWLVQAQGWRAALATLAAILGAGTILPHALLLRRRPEDLGLLPDGDPGPVAAPPAARRPPPAWGALGDAAFRWLAAAFWLNTLAMVAVSVHLLPYLTGRGHDAAFAAAATGALGLMQIVGRLLYAPLGDRFALRLTVATVLLVQPLALLVLLLVRDLPGILLFVVLFGAGRGAMTLVRPLSVAALYGPARFGSVNGVLALLLTLAQAAAPFAAGAGYDLLGSYEPVLWGLVAVSLGAAGAALLVGPAKHCGPARDGE